MSKKISQSKPKLLITIFVEGNIAILLSSEEYPAVNKM